MFAEFTASFEAEPSQTIWMKNGKEPIEYDKHLYMKDIGPPVSYGSVQKDAHVEVGPYLTLLLK